MLNKADQNVYSVGGIVAIVAGVISIFVTICIGVDPLGLLGGYSMEVLMKTDLTINFLWRGAFGFIGILNIPFMLAVSRFLKRKDGAYESFTQTATIIGLASGIISCLNWVHYIHVAQYYQYLAQTGHDVSAFLNDPVFPIDSYYFWSFGGLGIYFIAINIIGMKEKKIPLSLTIWGIITGIFSFGAFAGYIPHWFWEIGNFKINLMLIFGGLTGGILAPIYYFRLSRYLFRAAKDGQQ